MTGAHALDPGTVDGVESFLDEWLTDYGIPGASVAITDGDGLLYASGFGAREFEDNEPATPETLYPAASITKTFTAVAVLGLAEEEELSLSDPLGEYVDHFEEVPGEPITVRELLSHTSGMPSDHVAAVLGPRLAGGEGPTVPLSSREEFDRHVEGASDRRAIDRDRTMYYNSGYAVLGRVVETVTGTGYADYVADAILDPLGMDRSSFDPAVLERDEDSSPTYTADEAHERRPFAFGDHDLAAGGLVGSAVELAAFLRVLLGRGSADGTKLLDPASVAELTDPRGRMRTFVDGTPEHYGLGTMVREFAGGDRLVGHGGTYGSSGYVGYLEDAGVGVALLCNTTPDVHPMEVGPALLGLVEGVDPPTANPYFGVRRKLETVAGTYESYRGLQRATVEPDGLTLSVSLGREDPTTLTCFPESADPDSYEFYTFDAKLHRLPVEFVVSEDRVDLFVERNRLTRQR